MGVLGLSSSARVIERSPAGYPGGADDQGCVVSMMGRDIREGLALQLQN
jgi:hypothetical protein